MQIQTTLLDETDVADTIPVENGGGKMFWRAYTLLSLVVRAGRSRENQVAPQTSCNAPRGLIACAIMHLDVSQKMGSKVEKKVKKN